MNANLTSIAILLVILLISMTIHEMMHAFAADYLGDDTARLQGRLSFNPIVHIDPFFTVALPLLLLLSGSPYLFGAAKPVQVNFHRLRYGEFGGAIVGAVGPLTNFVLACISGLLFRQVNPIVGTTTYEVIKIAILLNVGLFLFNAIPWPPLDGSRVLYAFAPRPLQQVMENIERLGVWSILILFLIIYPIVQGPMSNLYQSLLHWLAPGLQV